MPSPPCPPPPPQICTAIRFRFPFSLEVGRAGLMIPVGSVLGGSSVPSLLLSFCSPSAPLFFLPFSGKHSALFFPVGCSLFRPDRSGPRRMFITVQPFAEAGSWSVSTGCHCPPTIAFPLSSRPLGRVFCPLFLPIEVFSFCDVCSLFAHSFFLPDFSFGLTLVRRCSIVSRSVPPTPPPRTCQFLLVTKVLRLMANACCLSLDKGCDPFLPPVTPFLLLLIERVNRVLPAGGFDSIVFSFVSFSFPDALRLSFLT